MADKKHVNRPHTSSSKSASLLVFEDTDVVIKMIRKGPSPSMRHISRTHRVSLDWLLDRVNFDPGIQFKDDNISK